MRLQKPETKGIELLAPAGDLEKLKIAVVYGADAVYFGGEEFSLRAGAGNLTLDEMREGIAFAHERGRKCYLTLNIFAHNEDVAPLEEYLEKIKTLDIDAFLVSDPGVLRLLKKHIPDAEIHLSTQANMTNYVTAGFWADMGVKRLVLARELTIDEIREIRENIPEDMELEAFVHGAMCISYSGRCLLSNFLNQRDANRGECSHPCRWKYALVEEKRPGEYLPVEEDGRGTYFMNSGDLCMIEHIPELIRAGVCSAKIEGRMKSVFYVATVVRAYRQAIDDYYEKACGQWEKGNSEEIGSREEEIGLSEEKNGSAENDEARTSDYRVDPEVLSELMKASHRKFTTGFFFNKPTGEDQNYITSDYEREYSFLGMIKSERDEDGFALVQQRNKIIVGDIVEVFGPGKGFFQQKITEMIDAETGEPITEAPHPKQMLKIRFDEEVGMDHMLRKAM